MAPKKQVQKMSLGDFLGDQNLGSWADEMEDMPLPSDSRTGYGDRRAVSSAAGFGDRSYSHMPSREPLPLPTKPPYTAHLGNLPFDATAGDIEDFFSGCEVTSVRIVEDKVDRRPKGFGYVEFATLDGLKRALELNMTQFHGRNIKISVADPPKDRAEGRELTDWTRKGPLPDLPQATRRASERGGSFRNYEAPDMERGGSRRGGNNEGDGRSRDFGNWERKGPLSPLPAAEPMRGPGRVRPTEGVRERKDSPSWGEQRSQDGSRPPRPERPAVERQPTAADLDNEWRARMRPDAPVKSKTPTPDPSVPPSPSHGPPTVRPRLNLAKRTVSEAEPAPTNAANDSKSSPFGAARPIDTSAREKEVVEKRELALRQKKEADEKAREEKKAKETAAKAAAENSADENDESDDKANGGEETAPSRSSQVLQRVHDDNEDTASDEPASKSGKPNGNTEEKPTKPRGPPREPREPREPRDSRDPPRGPKYNSNSWRRKPSGQSGQSGQSNPSSPATPTAGPDEDGWSTVGPAKQRSTRGRGTNVSRTAAT